MFNEFKVDSYTLMRSIAREVFHTSLGVITEIIDEHYVQVDLVIPTDKAQVLTCRWLDVGTKVYSQHMQPSVGDKCLIISLNVFDPKMFSTEELLEDLDLTKYARYGTSNCVALPFSTVVEEPALQTNYTEEGVVIKTKDGYNITVDVKDGGGVNITVTGGNVNIVCDEFNVNEGNLTVSK